MDTKVRRPPKDTIPRDKPPYPRLRRDLRSNPLETPEGTAYVVTNPATGRFFRLREVEWFIAQQLDGATSPEDIRRLAEQRFASELPAATLTAFLERARALGLFDEAENGSGKHRHGRPKRVAEPAGAAQSSDQAGADNADTAAAAEASRGRLRGDPLYLRFKAFNPERQIAWLLPKLRFCFTPAFVAAVLALALAAGFVTVGGWAQLRDEFTRLYQWQTVVYAWLVLVVTLSIHEFAHGLACTHFGGRVREMGVMLIYFQPAVYCNVSEAWMIPEKSRRIWVGAAGPFLDVLLWAAAMLLWRITDTDSALHTIALIVAVTTVARTLLNLNPLLKLDAYYVLADAIGIPNLRQRAFAYLRSRWSRQAAQTAEASPRERRIFIAYGLAAAVYSVALLGYVAAWFGGYLIERYHTLGLVLFTGLLLLIFRRPIGERRRALAAYLGQRLPAFAALRPRLALAMPAALGLALLFPFSFTAGGNFMALPRENADIRAEVAGIIEEVFVTEGESVATGAPIVRLANHDRVAELGQVEATIREKQARLKMLRSGTRAEDLAIARQKLATAATRETEARSRLGEERRLHSARLAAAEAGVVKAQEQMQYAEDKYALMEPLASVLSPLELREARAEAAIRRKGVEESQAGLQFVRSQNQQALREALAVAAAKHREAEGELQLLLAGSRPEEIEAVEAEIASLQTRATDLRNRIARATVRAPHPGVVTTARLRESVGQHMESGSLVATVHDLRRITAEIAISERDIADVRVGQLVSLRVRAYPTETFTGRVVGIAPATAAAELPGAPRVVRVITEIDNSDGRIKSDMTGYAKIELGARPLFEILGHNLFASLGVEFWSWW